MTFLNRPEHSLRPSFFRLGSIFQVVLMQRGEQETHHEHRDIDRRDQDEQRHIGVGDIVSSRLTRPRSLIYFSVIAFAAPAFLLEGFIDITFSRRLSSALFRLLALSNSTFACAVNPIDP